MLCRILNSNLNNKVLTRGIRQCAVLNQKENVPQKVETSETQIRTESTNQTPTMVIRYLYSYFIEKC